MKNLKIQKMKNRIVLPIVAIFLVAMSVGDKLWSLPYLLKIIPAFILILIYVIWLIIDLMKRNKQ